MAPSPPSPVSPYSAPPAVSTDADSLFPHASQNAFTDAHRRTLLLRGLNVSGDAKFPRNNPLAGTPEFYDTSSVSFSGRPFRDAAEATLWWGRLRTWGVGVARLTVCWEALEPREMGVYDDEYIAYLHSVVEEARRAGIVVLIDGHQDVWSRFTGGSGAPLWTFSVVGLDATVFSTTCSAALDQPGESSPLSTPSGRLWPTNYSKFGVATMFTLFFAGEVFAPSAVYPGPEPEFAGKNVGYVLRTAYTRAYAHLLQALKDLPNVLGMDPMNEPHPGYIGLPSLHYFNENTDLHLGYMPNALQSMALAAGVPTSVPYYSRTWPHPSKKTRNDVLNRERVSAWLPGRDDIWRTEGVYEVSADSSSVTLGPRGKSYFYTHPRSSAKIDFERDFYVPFLRSFQASISSAVRGGRAGSWLFVEPVPNLGPPAWEDSAPRADGDEKICYSPHWYDIRVLFEKALWYAVSFDVLSLAGGSRNFLQHTYFGRTGLTTNYAANFRRFLGAVRRFRPSGKPTPILIGETGIPFDINRQVAYGSGNVHTQLVQLDSICHAMEKSNLNWTLWTFALSHNTLGPRIAAGKVENQTKALHQSGDGWNSEDFSVVSSDPATTELPLPSSSSDHPTPPTVRPNDYGTPLTRAADFGELYRGARLAPALVRPYAAKTAGVLERSEFHLAYSRFELEYVASAPPFEHDLERTTEAFMPAYHFGPPRRVVLRVCVVDVKRRTVVGEREFQFTWRGRKAGADRSEERRSADGRAKSKAERERERERDAEKRPAENGQQTNTGERTVVAQGEAAGVRWCWELHTQTCTLVHSAGTGGRRVCVLVEAMAGT